LFPNHKSTKFTENTSGMVPDNWLDDKCTSNKCDNDPMDGGIVPFKLFWYKTSVSKYSKFPNSDGNEPVKLLSFKYNAFTAYDQLPCPSKMTSHTTPYHFEVALQGSEFDIQLVLMVHNCPVVAVYNASNASVSGNEGGCMGLGVGVGVGFGGEGKCIGVGVGVGFGGEEKRLGVGVGAGVGPVGLTVIVPVIPTDL